MKNITNIVKNMGVRLFNTPLYCNKLHLTFRKLKTALIM